MKGLVRIRLVRMGRMRQPVYNIAVGGKRDKVRGLPIEVIGTYDPTPTPLSPTQRAAGVIPVKNIELDFERAKYWISVGAQPSDSVSKLFKKAGILHEQWPTPQKALKSIKSTPVSSNGKVFA